MKKKRIAHVLITLFTLTCSAYGQAEPQVPFDLEKFQPVLSECRLHSPRTSSPIAVSNGNFGGYELPGRFYLGADGTTMVLGTISNDRDRSELRHNTRWSVLGEEKRLSARLRFDKPVALGSKRSRLNFVQVYKPDESLGPIVLVQWRGSWEADGEEDQLGVFVQGAEDLNLGPRPDGFFDLDVVVEHGILRIYIDNELKGTRDISRFSDSNVFFKTGNYHRGILAHEVEFESLSISTAPPGPSLMLEPAEGDALTVMEGSDPSTYSAVLNRVPNEEVTVSLGFDNVVNASPTSLTFTPSNWDVPQVVSVTAVDEEINQLLEIRTIINTTSSLDPAWDGLSSTLDVSVLADGYAAPVVDAGPNQTLSISDDIPWLPSALFPAGWYDASDAATLTLDGSAVSQWRDKSGNNLHLAQAEASRRPLTGVHTIHGMTTVKFDGSNDHMVTSSNPFGSVIQDAFVITVHRHDGRVRGTLFSLSGSSASGNRWQAHAPWDDHRLYFDTKSGSDNRIQSSYGVSVGDVILTSFYGSVTESTQQVFKNGSLLASGNSPGTLSNPPGNWFVGSGANTQHQNTSIAEMIVINGRVNADERQKLEGYLAHKWALQANLPANHPYKSEAPGGPGVALVLDPIINSPLSGGLTISWSWESGPNPVSFANASDPNTTAFFTEFGKYVLGLTVSDGVTSSYDEITVTVIDPNSTAPEVDAGPDQIVTISGVAQWIPTALPLAAWYDASDESTITKDGSHQVSQWRDRSGNQRHVNQSSNNAYPLSGTRTLNGLNALAFSGSASQFLRSTEPMGEQPLTAFAVVQFDSTDLDSTVFDGAGSRCMLRRRSNGALALYAGSWVDGETTAAEAVLVSVEFNGANSAIRKNGGTAASGDPGAEGLTSGLTIGNISGNPGENWRMDGLVSELIFLSASLPDTERQRLEGYLAHKWGLQVQLPGAHPYKNAAPEIALATASLNGSASDEGSDSLTTLWSLISGPGPVLFEDSGAVETTATFFAEGTYVLRLTADDGFTQIDDDTTITVVPETEDSFSDWIAGFDLGEQEGFDDDYNNDGVPNGLKFFFAIDPREPSPGLSIIAPEAANPHQFTFTHPMAEGLPANVEGEYLWSKDLATFHADGTTNGDGTSVTFVRSEPVDGMVTVTATIHGTPTDRIFVKLVVTELE